MLLHNVIVHEEACGPVYSNVAELPGGQDCRFLACSRWVHTLHAGGRAGGRAGAQLCQAQPRLRWCVHGQPKGLPVWRALPRLSICILAAVEFLRRRLGYFRGQKPLSSPLLDNEHFLLIDMGAQ